MVDMLKKLSAVVALTGLIWAWAYLALEETMPATGTLSISPATRSDLFVSFEEQPASLNIQLTLKGSPGQMNELKKRLRADDTDPQKERLEFFYDVELENHSAPGRYPLDLLTFLNESDKLKNLAVSVEHCEPATINVKVDQLTQKWFNVQVLDENKEPLRAELIEPSTIQMHGYEHWSGDSLKANVILTAAMIDKARREPVSERPFIELQPGRRRWFTTPVAIKLPSTESPLKDRVTSPLLKLGIIYSKNLQGKYNLELTNENDLRTVQYKASDAAYNAYEKMPYLIMIEVRDGDENRENVHRPIIYNFPTDFVRKGEIELTGAPREAVFKLVPIDETPG
ncbi:MAG: hypothetical protein IH624_19400 [Phycisphaerae bacterium]|nr:hypothetical protein [Phycisphaerae bacterium]